MWSIEHAQPCQCTSQFSSAVLQSAVEHVAVQDIEHAQQSWHLPADLARSAAQQNLSELRIRDLKDLAALQRISKPSRHLVLALHGSYTSQQQQR